MEPTLSARTNSPSVARLPCCSSSELHRLWFISTLSFFRSLSRSFMCRSICFCSFFSWSILSAGRAAGGRGWLLGVVIRVCAQSAPQPRRPSGTPAQPEEAEGDRVGAQTPSP